MKHKMIGCSEECLRLACSDSYMIFENAQLSALL